MVGSRKPLATLRTAFFIGIWTLIALVPLRLSLIHENVGYLAISMAVLIFGSVVTRAPDERRFEALTEPFGRFLLLLALLLVVIGGVLVWL
jgi:hypothetical protein